MPFQPIKHILFASILLTLTACSDNTNNLNAPVGADTDSDGIEDSDDDFSLNAIGFEDANFARCVKSAFDDMGAVSLSEITVLECPSMSISSVTHLNAFPSLDHLNLYENNLTEIDVTQNTALTYLHSGRNQLTEIDVTKNTALTYLHSGSNQLTEIDVTQNTALTVLDLKLNPLTPSAIGNLRTINWIDDLSW